MNIKIKGIEEYDLENDEKTKFTLVHFDFTTEKGTVTLSEYVTFGYNNYAIVEKTDSNVKCNMADTFESIVSEDDDFCIGDLLECVEQMLNDKYIIEDEEGHSIKEFINIKDVEEQLHFYAEQDILKGTYVRYLLNDELVEINEVDDIKKIYTLK